MKKRTAVALAVAIPTALSYAAAWQVFKFGFNRYEGNTYWDKGTVKGPYAKRINSGMRWLRMQKLKKIMIRSKDRLRLYARILEHPSPKGVFLLMHGYHSSAIHDFSCAIEYYYNMGYTIVMPDQRAHGSSDGKYITFGIKEKYDCRLWAEYIAKKYAELPIFLDGISMGASTVMLAAGLGLPKAVCGIIADCGYSHPLDICSHVLKNRMGIHPALVLPIAKRIAMNRASVDFEDGNVGRALIRNTNPLLMVHGEADTFVPCHMTDKNASFAKNCDLTVLKIPGADHGMSFLTDEATVKNALERFLDKCIKNYNERLNSTTA